MDLYSAKTSKLRAELDAARAAMIEADARLGKALETIKDVGALNPDGQTARLRATTEYRKATERYRNAILAWADQALRSKR